MLYKLLVEISKPNDLCFLCRMTTDLSQLIVEKCYEKYRTLPKKGKPKDTEWTVLSCLALVKAGEGEVSLVSLATGTKCLDGLTRRNSLAGTLLHDSHAEILARRGFLLWLLHQIELAQSDKSPYIQQAGDGGGGFVLSAEYRVVMVSTSTPCGDASIFLKETAEPSMKKPRLDLSRTGAKPVVAGCDPLEPGLGYHTTGHLRTKPGRGQRTLSLSCSDKILKWNLLGLQGGLLSFLLAANIYLDTFIIADQTFSPDSMERAFYGRADYPGVNQPALVKVDLQFEGSKSSARLKPSPDSLVWVGVEGGRHEAVTEGHRQGWAAKRLDNSKSWSMLCQRNIARTFLQLYQGKAYSTYDELKKHSKYYSAKKSLEVEILKSWPVKSVSAFSLDKL